MTGNPGRYDVFLMPFSLSTMFCGMKFWFLAQSGLLIDGHVEYDIIRQVLSSNIILTHKAEFVLSRLC
jgi:hypothetical protein